MIIERLQIPDEVYESYGSTAAMQRSLLKTVEYPDRHVILGPATIETLKNIFGGCDSEEDLTTRVKRYNILKVQGEEYKLEASQVQRLITQAFFYSKTGEPRSPEEATPEEQELIVNRYVKEQIDYYMGQMLGDI
jgi:hypothetical protein